jgi:hypothetical protein
MARIQKSDGAPLQLDLHTKGGIFIFFTLVPKTYKLTTEPVFLNVYGAQESIPRNEFRQSV